MWSSVEQATCTISRLRALYCVIPKLVHIFQIRRLHYAILRAAQFPWNVYTGSYTRHIKPQLCSLPGCNMVLHHSLFSSPHFLFRATVSTWPSLACFFWGVQNGQNWLSQLAATMIAKCVSSPQCRIDTESFLLATGKHCSACQFTR